MTEKMPERRLSMRLDEGLAHDLHELTRRLNLSQSNVIRLAVRELAERRGIPVAPEGKAAA